MSSPASSASKRSKSPPMVGPTVDFALIEASKENIRPVQSGRSAAALSVILDKDEGADAKLQEGYSKFQKDIEEAQRRDKEGEDMLEPYEDLLDVYNQYVQFSVQHQTASGSHLLSLLESATRTFIDDDRYKNELRYLRLWVMFARLTERREEVFAFLESRQIGSVHSLLYEEWAIALIDLNRKRKADDIYRLGINRKAQPLARLKNRHQAFLERTAAPDGSIPDDEPIAPPAESSRRTVLGQMATPGHTSAGSSQSAPSARNPARTNGSKMAIFADGDAPAEDAEGGVWQDFGTREDRRKENVVEATSWKGETMPQSAKKGLAPRTPKMEIFKDTTNGTEGSARPADDIFVKGRLATSEADLIRFDPLRYHDRSAPAAVPTSLPAPPSARKAPRPAPLAAAGDKPYPGKFVPSRWEMPSTGPLVRDAAGKIKEKRMFDWDSVHRNNDEWSWAEVRARQRGLLGREYRGDVQDWEREWHAPGASTPVKEPVQRARPPSPTVNTKLANEEIAAMFDQTIHGQRKRVNDSDSDSSDDSDSDGDEGIQMAPTPLPARAVPTPLPAPTPVLAVPPTPTPAGGAAPGRLNIFADENNVPGSAMKTPRANIFDVRTPGRASEAEAPASSSRKAFGIFADENAENAPAKTPLAPKVGGSVFATPAPKFGSRASRTVLQNVITEEEDEEQSRAEQDGADGQQQFGSVQEEEYEEDEEVDYRRRPLAFNPMTPITERTCEYTSYTAISRLSLASTTTDHRQSLSGPRSSVSHIASAATSGVQDLSVVDEEDERSRPERSSVSASAAASGLASPEPERFFDTDQPIHQSFASDGHAGPDFALPEGFTIHPKPVHQAHDMSVAEVVDRSARISLAPTEDGDAETDTGAFVTATAGFPAPQEEGILPNPCCPVEDHVINTIIGLCKPPLDELPGFVDMRFGASSQLDVLNKFAKSRLRRSQNNRASLSSAEGHELQLGERDFEVTDKIGEGGFGAVFLAVDLQKRDDLEDDQDEDEALVAIKVESPTALWEAVVLDRMHRRLDSKAAMSIIRSQLLFAFLDESFLVLDYSSQGTLLDLVNKAQSLNIAPATAGAPQAIDEMLAIFFTIELLRLVEQLHSSGFIHGDLKIDNCMVRLENIPEAEGGNASWSSEYRKDGSDGWSRKGVRVIDLGRAIDLSLWPAGEKQQFVADWPVDDRDCTEIKEGRSWSYQTDYAGLASVAYCLLFGKYIQTETEEVDGVKRVKIATPLKRYWQTELWNQLFDTLLNSTAGGKELPITNDIAEIRVKFEDWLEANCQKGGKNLRGMLKKITTALASR